MYEENRKFSWTNFLIKAIIFVIFILFVMWLLSLSTKGLSNSLEVLTDNVMSTNIDRMKEVGREYFTIERLPSEVGDVKKITLQEMYDKNLILEIKDKNGEACSAENSYVSVEKLDSEYEMKVYLECGDEKDYIISVMGCTDLCGSDSCDIKEEEENEIAIDNDDDDDDKVIEYQYVLKTEGKWGEYGAWSDWTTTKIESSMAKQVQIKTVSQAYDYTVDVVKTIDYSYLTSCPSGYTYNNGKCYKNGTSTVAVPTCDSTYNGYTLVSQNGLTCNYSKNVTSTTDYTLSFVKQTNGSYMPSDTSVYHYEKVSVKDVLSCESSCKKQTIYTYNVYKKIYSTSTSTIKTTLSCPSGYTYGDGKCTKVTTSYVDVVKSCPSGTKVKADGTGCYKEVVTQETRTGYKEVTTYRFRTRTYIDGTTVYKWSTSKNDKKLLNAGYKLTGKTRTIGGK